ncbi:MAG: hypothetical protein HFG42_14680 [Lachnospiraceae bacterium]|nr:hypothetical protein [Lachnospiraceae bacterium]
MDKVPVKILEKVERTIEKYSLFEGREACVAYSGGKDSLFLCVLLKQLNYNVYPVIIDVGYNSDWSIALKNAEHIGLGCIKIGLQQVERQMPEIKPLLNTNLQSIAKIAEGNFKKATICTPCHNSKILILQRWAQLNHIPIIANGHHGIDAISSMLKSFYMYTDRWEKGHIEFSYENFYNLILSQKKSYLLEEGAFRTLPLANQLLEQIQKQNAGTDEPILQYLGESSIRLCRPLFHVLENEITEYFHSQELSFNESECFKTGYRHRKTLTPRELIQYELLRNAPNSLLHHLLELSKLSLDERGFLKFNVRNNRTKILGDSYKNERINNLKK